MELFYYLKSNKMDNEETIQKLSKHDIEKVCCEISELLPNAEYSNSSYFDFSTNITLQGGAFPCASYDCRIKQVDRTLRFASLYAERMVFSNPLNEYSRIEKCTNRDLNNIKQSLYLDLGIVNYLKPAIEAGLVQYGSSDFHLCKNCFSNAIIKNKSEVEFYEELDEFVFKEFINDIEIKFLDSRGVSALQFDGPEIIVPHNKFIRELTNKFAKELKSKYKLCNGMKIDPEIIRDMKLLETITQNIFNSIFYGNYYSYKYGTNNLTDNEYEFKINSLYHNKVRTDEIIDMFEHSLPFIYDVDIKKIIEFRETEKAAFDNYRYSIKEAIAVTRGLDNRNLRVEAFSDIINPKLVQIDQSIKNQKKIFKSGMIKDICILGASIFMATNSTFFDTSISSYIKDASLLIGGADASHLYSKFRNSRDDSTMIKNDPMYFLWKVKNEVYKV